MASPLQTVDNDRGDNEENQFVIFNQKTIQRIIVVSILVIGALRYFYFIPSTALNYDTKQISNNVTRTMNEDELDFILKIRNKKTNNTLQCDPNTFKYIKLLLVELSKYNKPKWTTADISAYNDYPTERRSFIRFKHTNGSLYWSLSPDLPFYDQPFYRNRFIYYFYQLTEQYADSMADFDVVLFVHDAKNFSFNYNIFPFLTADATQYEKEPLLLHSISRSLAGQFVSDKYYSPYIRFKQHELSFERKKNVAVFRGHSTNPIRENVAIKVNNIANGTRYFDVKMNRNQHKRERCFNDRNLHCAAGRRMSVQEEMKYKYQLIMDGFGVRDSLPRQIRYKSVMIKQQSLLREFWYYDLINNENVIFWNNVTELIEIMKDIIDTKAAYTDELIYDIMLNSTEYANTHLDVDPINCFMIHMMQIYNKYFYDENSINITGNDLKITADIMYNDLARCGRGTQKADTLCQFRNTVRTKLF